MDKVNNVTLDPCFYILWNPEQKVQFLLLVCEQDIGHRTLSLMWKLYLATRLCEWGAILIKVKYILSILSGYKEFEPWGGASSYANQC